MSETTNRVSPEVQERAVEMVLDGEEERGSHRAAIVAAAPKIRCAAQMPNGWCERAKIDLGRRAGVSTEMVERIKAQERETREPRQADEILAKASVELIRFRGRPESSAGGVPDDALPSCLPAGAPAPDDRPRSVWPRA